jgi:uncharacterized delta-60 repeat protein
MHTLVQSLEQRRFLNGTVDSTYPVATLAAPNSQAGFYSDGRAAFATLSRSSNGTQTLQVRRRTAAGAADSTFGTGGIAQVSLGVSLSTNLNRVLVDTVNRVLVFTSVRRVNTTAAVITVARFNSNGTVDTTFGTSGVATVNFSRVPIGSVFAAVDVSGRPYVAASTRPTGAGNSDLRAARLTSAGSLDTGWGASGFYINNPTASEDLMYDFKLASDGKPLVAANAGSVLNQPRVFRVNTNGTADTGFTSALTGLEQFQLLPQTDGKTVIVAQDSTTSALNRLVVQRLNTNGSTDTSFVTGGRRTITTPLPVGVIQNLTRDTAGNLYVMGVRPSNSTSNQFVFKLNSNGTLNTSFGSAGAITPRANLFAGLGSFAVVSGKLMVATPFALSPGTTVVNSLGIARYNIA